MRRAKNRARKVTVTPALVDLFRKAWPANRAHMNAIRNRKELPRAELTELIDAVQAFDIATDVPLWERFSPLHPRATDRALQTALVDRLPFSERKAWRRYCRQWEREREADARAEDRKQEKTPSAETLPRSNPNLRWGGHW